MISNKIIPANVLAGYVWEGWKENTGLGNIDVGGRQLARMAPIQDNPALADSGQTYMIYGFSENDPGALAQHHTGIIAFRIIGKQLAEINQAIRVMSDLFEEGDTAAHSVNLWSSRNEAMQGIRFTYVGLTYLEAADAATTEGGKMEAVVNLRYRYVINAAPKKFNGTGWVA